MSVTLKILPDLFLSLFGLGFIGWLFWRLLKSSEAPLKILFKSMLTLALLAGEILLIHKAGGLLPEESVAGGFDPVFLAVASLAVTGIVLSIIWTPHVSAFLISPLTAIFDGGSEPPELKPAYSAALSKRKAGRPLEAIVAIREQLAKFPNDFTGVMLLANIQAEDMDDLPGAEMTLNCFCESPRVPDRQVVAALTRLANWHLNQAADEEAALAILQKIMTRYPDAKISRRAAQRLALANGGIAAQIEMTRLKSQAVDQPFRVKTRRAI
jgi:hypothetical protein